MAAEARSDSHASRRESILGAAYALFARYGVRAIDLDDVATAVDLSRAELGRHFPDTQALTSAVLRRRDQLWTCSQLEFKSRLRGDTAQGQILAIFDVLHDWIIDFDGCGGGSPLNVLIEMGHEQHVDEISMNCLYSICEMVRERALQAGLTDVSSFVGSVNILLIGAVIAGSEGDLCAARRARGMAHALMVRHLTSTGG
ncbi:TetR/AcrR family transcriptional regulator [Mycobacterium camsae]|uniref:TetR/AcrR family transcriptional regulator n=1 Tax=Mycobacterium gordonae TaxID=1778 RepID=UPI00197D534A|nr:TetR family transcriptional regulator [Mycobacterium gordonae]